MSESFMPLNDQAEETVIPIKDSSSSLRKSRSGNFGSDEHLDIRTDGAEDTLEYRIKAVAEQGKKVVSLWHDISLTHMDSKDNKPTPYLNFVCEIPKFTRKKYEIATDEAGNPIKQDTKKGKLREFKKGDIFFNYGCFPQTWEDPTFIHPDAEGTRGDNDPLDVCEIGARIIQPGSVRSVKVLGILCMIDEGECDWKVVVIDAEDKWAPFIDDIQDVEEQLPGMLSAIREWYRTYKIPDGKPPNVFGLDEKFMDKKYAGEVIKECHQAWKELLSGEKERTIAKADDEVQKLVRKLSKNSLFELAPNVDEHPSLHMHQSFHVQDYEEEVGGIFF